MSRSLPASSGRSLRASLVAAVTLVGNCSGDSGRLAYGVFAPLFVVGLAATTFLAVHARHAVRFVAASVAAGVGVVAVVAALLVSLGVNCAA
jgi:hypothetical protein